MTADAATFKALVRLLEEWRPPWDKTTHAADLADWLLSHGVSVNARPCPHCLSPEDSAVIAREIREGTPDTPERIAFMKRADAAYAKTAAERCSICEKVAFFKCPKCGVEWYNRIQSLASSQEHDA